MANATKVNPVALPSAKPHQAWNVSLFPETAALATTVASTTAVVKVHRAPTSNIAHAVIVHQPSVRRDPAVNTSRLVTIKRDKATAAIQWTADQRMTPAAMLCI